MSASFAPALNNAVGCTAGVSRVGDSGAGVAGAGVSGIYTKPGVGRVLLDAAACGGVVLDSCAEVVVFELVFVASSLFCAILVGQVGSSGEWLKLVGVVEKSSPRSVSGFFSLSARAQAVQFDVIMPFSSHLSAGCSSAQ